MDESRRGAPAGNFNELLAAALARFDKKSNEQAILEMLSGNLAEWLISTNDADDLSRFFCTPTRCPLGYPDEIEDRGICLRCIEAWLDEPFAENFSMQNGQFTAIKEAVTP